jgi:hypothetical protein
MDEYAVDILPGELLPWIREDAERKSPQLWIRAAKTYGAAIDYDSGAVGLADADNEDITPVSVVGLMEVTPQARPGGWTLQVRAEDSETIPPSSDEGYEDESDMTVDAFISRFLIPERGEVQTVVLAEDEASWQRFQHWLERQRSSPGANRAGT